MKKELNNKTYFNTMKIITIANVITSIRILCSLTLLFYQALSPQFYMLYIIAGLSDMIDGIVARKTNTVSEFGSKLDTFADFIMMLSCSIKLIPVMEIPNWIYKWIAFIAIIKVINIISGYVKENKFVVVHSVMNKVTGGLLFLFPFSISYIELKYSLIIICIFATFAAIQEGHIIRTTKSNEEYHLC